MKPGRRGALAKGAGHPVSAGLSPDEKMKRLRSENSAMVGEAATMVPPSPLQRSSLR
ncbi:MAG: hypothetical protein IPG80_15490 [Anaerolineales bacterium]|uniref:hypothetical protein n=1 Tax=Candidatus Villigracilis vicinus TaxID=3140679 RepID=UPI0031350DE1|nr:hypothetical protein [Anaerolineales bacterium]